MFFNVFQFFHVFHFHRAICRSAAPQMPSCHRADLRLTLLQSNSCASRAARREVCFFFFARPNFCRNSGALFHLHFCAAIFFSRTSHTTVCRPKIWSLEAFDLFFLANYGSIPALKCGALLSLSFCAEFFVSNTARIRPKIWRLEALDFWGTRVNSG